MQPKLSVIIPVYNVEKYIRQCLDSVYSQTFRDFEVIIIDDGSPDNCGKICDEYAEKFGNEILTKVIHKENGGLTRAWSDGLETACGEWITFIDSDDWIEKDYFEAMFNALGAQKVDIFVAGGCYKNQGDNQLVSYYFDSPKLYCTREERDYIITKFFAGKNKTKNGKVFSERTHALWSKFYRSEFVRQHNLKFEQSMSAIVDVLFNFIAFNEANGIGVSTVYGYHYRQIGSSDSRRFNSKRKDSFVIFLDIVTNYLNRNNCNPSIKSALNVYSLALIYNALSTCFCHPDNPLSKREIAKEFMAYKKLPCFAEAIWERRNPYISFYRRVFRNILRLPWFTPIKTAYVIASKIRKD